MDSSLILLSHRIEIVEKKVDMILENFLSDGFNGYGWNFFFSGSIGVDPSIGPSARPIADEPSSQPSPLKTINLYL